MTEPAIYGLLGHPLGHSFSREYFSERFSAMHLDAEYLNFDIPLSVPLHEAVGNIIRQYPALKGFNVTIPYKRDIIPLLHSLSPEAAEIGAVNVVKVLRDDRSDNVRLIGFNTDTIGFSRSIAPYIKRFGTRALVLGSGGASLAVCHGLSELGITPQIVSRNPTNRQIGYNHITESLLNDYRIIVNTTPLGTWPDIETAPDIPYRYLSANNLCYDLVYNPPLTRFLSMSAKVGAITLNGREMLRIQADEAWKIWKRPTDNY